MIEYFAKRPDYWFFYIISLIGLIGFILVIDIWRLLRWFKAYTKLGDEK